MTSCCEALRANEMLVPKLPPILAAASFMAVRSAVLGTKSPACPFNVVCRQFHRQDIAAAFNGVYTDRHPLPLDTHRTV